MEFAYYILQSSLVIALFLLVYWIWLRKETHFTTHRHFLLSGMVLALLLPFAEITRTIEVVREPSPVTDAVFEPISLPLSGVESSAPSIDLFAMLVVIYLVGFIVVLFRFGNELSGLVRLIRRGTQNRINGHIYVEVDRAIEPFSFFRYIVYNPANHSAEELQIILEHERSHVHQWHTVDLFFANLLRMAFWFNPLAWWYRRAVEENLEFLADRSTLQAVASPTAYQFALVKASTNREIPMFTNPFYQSFIKKRIVMLNKQESPKINLLKTALVLPGLAIVLVSFNVKEVVTFVDPLPVVASQEFPPSQDGIAQEPAVSLQTSATSPEPPALATTIEGEKPATATGYTQSGTATVSSTTPKVAANTTTGTVVAGYSQASQPEVATTVQGIVIRISSETTEAQLKDHQRDLANQGITLDYSNLKYNNDGKLIGIRLSVESDSGNGNYHVHSDEPISDILIRITEEGMTIGSSGESYRRALASQERAMARAQEMEARQAERYQERLAMAEARQYEMQAKRAEGYKERAAMAEARQKEMQQRLVERELAMVERQEAMAERVAKARAMGYTQADGAVVWTGDEYNGHETLRADMTDAELKELQRKLAAKGVTMNYKKVKRNDSGEIIGIKVLVERGGSSSSTQIRTDDNEAIEPIRIKY